MDSANRTGSNSKAAKDAALELLSPVQENAQGAFSVCDVLRWRELLGG